MSGLNYERVLSVRHWTNGLFSFAVTREASFRFVNGQFTMIGIAIDDRPLLRAYSMASANYEDKLEFYSIKVPTGPLTSRLLHLREGDTILVGRKPTGTLIKDNLLPGRVLYLLSTGTGLAPFLSIVKDPGIYAQFERIVLFHGCRHVADLAYGAATIGEIRTSEILDAAACERLVYYPSVTREPFRNSGRITDLVASGRLFESLGLPPLDVGTDRLMLCGSPSMLDDMRAILAARGFTEALYGVAGHYAIERAFVES